MCGNTCESQFKPYAFPSSSRVAWTLSQRCRRPQHLLSCFLSAISILIPQIEQKRILTIIGAPPSAACCPATPQSIPSTHVISYLWRCLCSSGGEVLKINKVSVSQSGVRAGPSGGCCGHTPTVVSLRGRGFARTCSTVGGALSRPSGRQASRNPTLLARLQCQVCSSTQVLISLRPIFHVQWSKGKLNAAPKIQALTLPKARTFFPG